VTGEIGGTCVDQGDHVFTVNRRNLTAREMLVAQPSPPVIEFDREGNVVNAWGDPAILPSTMHGCFVDHENNMWLSGNSDGIVLKYTHDGSQLLLQIGIRGRCDTPTGACGETNDNNSSTTLLNGPANVMVDPANGDVYIADGYGNHRVVVFDKTGRFLRQWGSTGTGPGQFGATGGGHPHCVVLSPEGLLYVCDRPNHRIQVFDKMGNLQRILSEPGTPREATIGSANDLVFPREKRPTLMFTAGRAELVWIVDHATEMILAGFGRADDGRVHYAALDGHRLQGQHLHWRDHRRRSANPEVQAAREDAGGRLRRAVYGTSALQPSAELADPPSGRSARRRSGRSRCSPDTGHCREASRRPSVDRSGFAAPSYLRAGWRLQAGAVSIAPRDG